MSEKPKSEKSKSEKPKSEKHYHHGDLRTALVQAGRRILERDGLEALTLRACAREAGVSHAAPQHHFRNLAELLAAIATSGFDDFVASLEDNAKDAGDADARLQAMGIAYVAFAIAHPALYSIMFGPEAMQSDSEAFGMARGRAWDQLHDAVVAAHGSAMADSDAVLVWSLVHGHAMLRVSHCMPVEFQPDQMLMHALKTMSAGLNAGLR
jgi:AcrR family transcriptional regulator